MVNLCQSFITYLRGTTELLRSSHHRGPHTHLHNWQRTSIIQLLLRWTILLPYHICPGIDLIRGQEQLFITRQLISTFDNTHYQEFEPQQDPSGTNQPRQHLEPQEDPRGTIQLSHPESGVGGFKHLNLNLRCDRRKNKIKIIQNQIHL